MKRYTLEIRAGLEHQRIGIGSEARWIDLGLKSVGVDAASVPVHKVSFDLRVAKFLEFNARSDDFVVDVIGRQAGIGWNWGQWLQEIRSKRW